MTLATLCATLVCGVGCDKEEPLQVYQAPKDPPPVSKPAVAQAMSSPMSSQQSVPGVPTWTVPAGWKELPGDGKMRAATFIVSESPKAELTVIPLGAEAGELLPNVNRWEGQLTLPPTPAGKLAEVAKPIEVNGLKATTVDLTGPESASPRQRLLAAIVPAGGRIWYFKLMGPIDVVSAQKQNFDTFVQSLKPGTGAASPAGPEAMPAGPLEAAGPMQGAPQDVPPANVKLAHWTTPPKWTEIPGSNGPRVLAFSIEAGADKKTEVVITKFPTGATGDFLSNINRWRGQIGLDPVTEIKSTPMKDITLGRSGEGILIEFSNPAVSKRMLVVIGSMGSDLWFYKLSGAAEVVDAQREPFAAFLKSLEFGPVENDGGK